MRYEVAYFTQGRGRATDWWCTWRTEDFMDDDDAEEDDILEEIEDDENDSEEVKTIVR